jgi:hypothetical protein
VLNIVVVVVAVEQCRGCGARGNVADHRRAVEPSARHAAASAARRAERCRCRHGHAEGSRRRESLRRRAAGRRARQLGIVRRCGLVVLGIAAFVATDNGQRLVVVTVVVAIEKGTLQASASSSPSPSIALSQEQRLVDKASPLIWLLFVSIAASIATFVATSVASTSLAKPSLQTFTVATSQKGTQGQVKVIASCIYDQLRCLGVAPKKKKKKKKKLIRSMPRDMYGPLCRSS